MKQISFLIIFLIIHSLNAQIPTELKGKWRGEIITQNQGREITGMAVVNIGQKKAKNENEVFFDLSQYTSSRIYVFEELTVNYKNLSDAGEVGFTSNHSLVIDANRNSVEGDFDFYLSKYGDKDCLIGHFQSKSGVKAKIILFRKNEYFQVFNTSQYANWKKDISPTKGRVITDKDIPTILFEEPQVVDVELIPEAEVLFKNVNSKLTNTEKNGIAIALGFHLINSDNNFFTRNVAHEEPFDVETYPLDINQDGIEELFFKWGTVYIGGNPLSNHFLVTKDNNTGIYIRSSELPGIPKFLESKTKGFNDLVLGGPGFEFPKYEWNGKTYQKKGLVSDDFLKKNTLTFYQTMSLNYQKALNMTTSSDIEGIQNKNPRIEDLLNLLLPNKSGKKTEWKIHQGEKPLIKFKNENPIANHSTYYLEGVTFFDNGKQKIKLEVQLAGKSSQYYNNIHLIYKLQDENFNPIDEFMAKYKDGANQEEIKLIEKKHSFSFTEYEMIMKNKKKVMMSYSSWHAKDGSVTYYLTFSF